MKKTIGLIMISAAFIAALILSGCSPQERAGVSPIPHNRPAEWESRNFAR